MFNADCAEEDINIEREQQGVDGIRLATTRV